jgi:hypothetical protein
MKPGLYHLITSKRVYPISGFDMGGGLCKLQIGTISSILQPSESYRLETTAGSPMICLNPGFQSSDTRKLDTVWLERIAS